MEAQAFISQSWYPSTHESHRQVPTWNDEVIHAHGTLAVRDDERSVRGLVARLTRQHEAAEPRPWKMSDPTPEFIDAKLRNKPPSAASDSPASGGRTPSWHDTPERLMGRVLQ